MIICFTSRAAFLRLWCLTMVCLFVHFSFAQDSLRVIEEITICSQIRYHETIEPQKLSSEVLDKVSAHTMADALRWISGVQLKDYGGIGGLKTVNLRSMGSQHIGIYYDGIELGNAQNGVIDLGQFSLDNVQEISLYNGQRSAILQTASDFANAGSIYISTNHSTPHLDTKALHRLKYQLGSSSTHRLSYLYSHSLNDHITYNINAEGLISSGKYPFRYQRRNMDGTLAYDTTAIRQNCDIQSIRLETNMFGQINQGHWHLKAYNFSADRGIPGAIVNNVWRRGERQTDNNTFVQGQWQKDFNDIYTLKALAKYAYYRTHYLNQDTTILMVDNHYRQQEAYLSLIQVFELRSWWSTSLSYDIRWNYLSADLQHFAFPIRWSNLVSVATAMDLGRLQLQASGVYSHSSDHVRLGSNHTSSNFAPALFLSYQLQDSLKLKGFMKKSFRMPTFNDLYYTEIGNANLKPEIANQYSLGFQYNFPSSQGFIGNVVIEAYHNSIHDKIVAYPKGQQFRWTMLNLGLVHIDGLEFRSTLGYQISPTCQLTTMLQYTYQQAKDLTDSKTSYFGHQIPYTPWHSGNATLMLDYRHCTLAYNFVYTGERYSQMENIRYNHLEPWYTSDLTLSMRYRNLKLLLEARNILDQQYDVIINYPMPGRNYNLTIQCEF